MSNLQPADHRPRVAAERRARMRRRLIESALLVLVEKGPESSVIDDVIVAAGVSRGTFYNYFRTNEELVAAVNMELSNEVLSSIESRVGHFEDPARRIASGLRLYLRTAQAFPLFAQFLNRVGMRTAGPRSLIYEYLPPHLRAGMAQNRFISMPVSVGVDLIAGTTLLGVFRIAGGEAAASYPEEIVTAILRGLGMSTADAQALVSEPIEDLRPDPDTLIVRSHQRNMNP